MITISYGAVATNPVISTDASKVLCPHTSLLRSIKKICYLNIISMRDLSVGVLDIKTMVHPLVFGIHCKLIFSDHAHKILSSLFTLHIFSCPTNSLTLPLGGSSQSPAVLVLRRPMDFFSPLEVITSSSIYIRRFQLPVCLSSFTLPVATVCPCNECTCVV